MIKTSDMRTVGLFEAKQKLSEMVERASEGERIGITRRGKLAAVLVPAQIEIDVKEVFQNIERIRKRVRRQKGVRIKDLINEGRL
ncbi:MAG TPA: type II toxin-antitoxin system prevent-host-death family antitoxin [Terriglobales bacterium]|nr:type II toxin-antitoxin system prevent-host-death family antitoxin [Terriglobales bacterium]